MIQIVYRVYRQLLQRKNFAGGQLRVTLKLSDGTQLIASRYGIDASVAEGQTVRCSFLPADAVLVDREDIHEEA